VIGGSKVCKSAQKRESKRERDRDLVRGKWRNKLDGRVALLKRIELSKEKYVYGMGSEEADRLMRLVPNGSV
jgi:hypothetical protein